MKLRQSAEMELGEVQAQLEEAQRLRADAEERAGAAVRERADIRTQLEENEEELAEVVLELLCSYVILRERIEF
jgi:myosin-18